MFLSKVDKKDITTVTNSAYIQQRSKLSYKFFIDVNHKAITSRYYDKKENKAGYKKWNEHIILATDGSQIRLPDEKEIIKKYGTSKIKNGKGEVGEYTHGLLSILYDPLNDLALDTILERGDYSERALAIRNIMNIEETLNLKNILLLYDRGYYSGFLATIILGYKQDFLFRLKSGAIKEADEMFRKDSKINSKIIEINVENKQEEYEKKYGIEIKKELKERIKIRLIRVLLNTGEIEVLATSLLDEEKYKTEEFGSLYYQRWGIEVYYNILKNRLGLENFSGKSVESVLQDLYSTIFISNYETIMTLPVNYELEQKVKEKGLKNNQKVNKQVSFNVIKNRIIELFLTEKNLNKIMNEIYIMFGMNVTLERKTRENTKKNDRKITTSKSLHFNKRKKKSCF